LHGILIALPVLTPLLPRSEFREFSFKTEGLEPESKKSLIILFSFLGKGAGTPMKSLSTLGFFMESGFQEESPEIIDKGRIMGHEALVLSSPLS
jgi:hypothetical protein